MVFELMKKFGKKNNMEKIFYRGFYADRYPFKKEWFKKYYGLKAPSFLNGKLINFLDDAGSKIAYKLNSGQNLIYHSFYHRIPKNHKGPLVVHAYDMIQELFYSMPKASEFKRKSFEKANLIVAISKSTKDDLCRICSVSPDKVMVAHLAADEIFFEKRASAEKVYKRPYMLYVGGRGYKYKNFDFLLDIFISKKYFLDFDLVLFGGEKNLAPEQKEKIKKTAGEGNWLLQEFGDDKKLPGLYANASVFCYPSLYEGFGIPLLEAMAAGCPMVACDSSSVPEVVGGAGLLFDPKDPDDLPRKIEKIINDKKMAADLVWKGKERARQFTWDKTADTIYQSYLKLQ